MVSAYPGRVVLPLKYNQSCFAFCELLRLEKFGMGFFWSLTFSSGSFWGFVESPHSIIPSHLKSRVNKTENWKRLERIANVSSPFFSVFPVLGFHYFWSALHYLTAAWTGFSKMFGKANPGKRKLNPQQKL